VLAIGRGIFELTGFQEPGLIGRDVVEALRLRGFENGKNPIALALEWGVRQLDEQLEMTTATGIDKAVIADIFPAYDEDGGLLVALRPR
jgi:hypothetical protein